MLRPSVICWLAARMGDGEKMRELVESRESKPRDEVEAFGDDTGADAADAGDGADAVDANND